MSTESSELFEWHVLSASAEEIEGVCAHPSAFYIGSEGSRRELRLSAKSAVVLRDLGAMHWHRGQVANAVTNPDYVVALVSSADLSRPEQVPV